MESGEWTAIGLGAFGSLMPEVVLLQRSYRRGPNRIAARYRDANYWAVVAAIAAGAGVIAWAYHVPGLPKIFYVQVGVAMPTILNQFRTPPSGGED